MTKSNAKRLAAALTTMYRLGTVRKMPGVWRRKTGFHIKTTYVVDVTDDRGLTVVVLGR